MPQPLILLASLVAGFIAGLILRAAGIPELAGLAEYVVLVGEIWLRALQMTVLPLLIALLITGIAGAGDMAASGRVATRSLFAIFALVAGATVIGLVVIFAFLGTWPVADHARAALVAALAMGVPTSLLAILVAVEVLPDLFRTVGNVTADVSVTRIVATWERATPDG